MSPLQTIVDCRIFSETKLSKVQVLALVLALGLGSVTVRP